MIKTLLERLFHLVENKTTVRRELLAGLTSFMAMCYLIFVVPAMLADAGMPRDSAVASTIWITIAATLLMGIYANFPVAVAPGLGITAFFAYYVCGPGGYDWQTGLGAVFISGVVFLLLTATRIRQLIIDSVPIDLKYSVVVGIGAFIAFIGMKNCGIVVADPSTFVTLGTLSSPQTLLAILGIFLTGALHSARVPGGMLLSIIVVSALGIIFGVSSMPRGALFNPVPPLPLDTFARLDISGALEHGLFSIIFTLTMVDLFDNMGTLIGLSQKAGFIERDGHIKNLDKALVSDSIATMGSAVIGATTASTYLESATGVAEGGRTGLTAVTIAMLFFLTLFCAPLVAVVPTYATAPTLIVVGAMMMQECIRIRFNDFLVALPAFLTIVTMPLTFNIATGFCFGFVSWVGIRLLTGRFRDLNVLMICLAVCFAINFALRVH
ncbi:MAG: NCS2 family permease [Desulfovibrio sp.]|nr:NCS2 family permease [Desulfovibrio sp.]